MTRVAILCPPHCVAVETAATVFAYPNNRIREIERAIVGNRFRTVKVISVPKNDRCYRCWRHLALVALVRVEPLQVFRSDLLEAVKPIPTAAVDGQVQIDVRPRRNRRGDLGLAAHHPLRHAWHQRRHGVDALRGLGNEVAAATSADVRQPHPLRFQGDAVCQPPRSRSQRVQ